MDAEGYKYELTAYFNDGQEPISMRLMRETSIEIAKNSWYATQRGDAELGVHYEITHFEVKEL